ncbi:hypothetical protein [Myroides fluvii]|uniref:hypothetical protein n=1 Tax=Myroides fluvii TaxID=2572594 RepID=UPI00131E34EC|nr:hypothetical protein [Myroides fluvii]
MKKLVAICAFLALPFAISSCSSDDNSVIRKKSDYEGTWVTDSLFYSIPNGPSMKHKFKEFPGEDAVEEDVLVLTSDKAVLVEKRKQSGVQPDVKGEINAMVITFNSDDARLTPRTIQAVTASQLTVLYDINMRGFNLPVRVTYKRQ